MASNPAARRLTETHRLAQSRLGAQVVRLMLAAWPLLDPNDLDATTERWLRVVVPLVRANRSTSAALAANYATLFRRLEADTAEPFTPTPAVERDVEAVTTSLLVTGPVAVKTHMRISPVVARAMEIGRSMSSSSAMRHALSGGRDTIIDSVRADPAALGWARVISGKPCGFCAMLASRGPVYGEDTAGFEAHDHCSCGVEPIYHQDAAWPPGSRAYRALWDDVTAGLGGDDARNAFRQAVESPQTAVTAA